MKQIKKMISGQSDKGNKFSLNSHRFPDLKVDKIASKLKIEKHGKDDGKSGIPASNSSAIAAAELEAIDEVRNLRSRALNNFEMEMESYASRIASVKSQKQQISLMVGKTKNEILTHAYDWENKLENERVRVAEHQQKLRKFQNQNNMEGPPHEHGNVFITVGMVLLVGLLETGMNAYFFQKANPMGIVGGAALAFIISALNVIGSGIFGFFSRHININRTLARARGYLLIVAFIVFATTVNLAVAHLRDALETNSWDASLLISISTLLESPLGLRSFESWVVCFFGGLVSFVSFWKAFSFFESYPGYKKFWDENEEAVKDYADLYKEAQESLNELFENAAGDLRSEVDKRRSSLMSAEDAVASRETLVRNLSVFLESCNSAANRLLRIYRDANLKTRGTPEPSYFQNSFAFEDYEIPDVSAKTLKNPEKAEKDIETLEEEVAAGVKVLLAERQNSIVALPTIRQIRSDASTVTASQNEAQEDGGLSAKAATDI